MIKGSIRLVVVVLLALGILSTTLVAAAQHIANAARVGVLVTALEPAQLDALRQGMRELGWLEGQNLQLEIRSAEGQSERLDALATALVALKVHVIFTGDIAAASAARKATVTVPHVGASLSDAVAQGFAESFARPGGNVTGLSLQAEELTGKWFELLKEVRPSLSRVAIFHHARPAAIPVKEYEAAARTLGPTSPHDMALPGLKLHQLVGDRKGTWAVAVSGNWRVTFPFIGKDADAVDYEDYH